MYYICAPSKIQIYVNSARKTTLQIKKETGCDTIINGGIYDMRKFIPYCWLKVNGQLLAHDQYGYFGYGWNDKTLVMDTTANIARYSNFMACVALLKDNQKLDLIYPADMGGRRGRSAIGVRSDGQVVVYCTKDGSAYSYTPEQLQTEMQNLGCVSALMLDGGLSSQCIMPNGTITSARDGGSVAIHNYILIWLNKEPEKPISNTQTTTQTPKCSYGTKDTCNYRLPCHYCLKQYQMCPLLEGK